METGGGQGRESPSSNALQLRQLGNVFLSSVVFWLECIKELLIDVLNSNSIHIYSKKELES